LGGKRNFTASGTGNPIQSLYKIPFEDDLGPKVNSLWKKGLHGGKKTGRGGGKGGDQTVARRQKLINRALKKERELKKVENQGRMKWFFEEQELEWGREPFWEVEGGGVWMREDKLVGQSQVGVSGSGRKRGGT